jgi:DNA-binding NtrC family response regulator
MSQMQEPPTLEATLSPADRAASDAIRPVCQLFFGLACDRPMVGGPHVVLDDMDALDVGRGAFDELASPPLVGPRIGQLRRTDAWMSTRHARLRREPNGAWVVEDVGSKNGTFVDGERVVSRRLQDGAVLIIGQTLLIYRSRLPRPAAVALPDLPGLATRHPMLAAELGRLVRVASSPLAVLIQGETGTGKELSARALHQLSASKGAFVALNCAALPAGMLEGELFGYRKGAFSGAARDHVGLVRAAEGGTLFLDEVGDLPLPAQAALLRVLQEHEVLPLGETRPIKVSFRLVCATHQDLAALVERQGFRRDLRARIADFVLELPPLRHRREDLGLLIGTFLQRANRTAVRFDTDAALALFRHDWPANVRELERALNAALVLAQEERIGSAHLPVTVRESLTRPTTGPQSAVSMPIAADVPPQPTGPLSAADEELKAKLLELFAKHDGSIAAVARELGKERVQIRRWIRRYGIDVAALKR